MQKQTVGYMAVPGYARQETNRMLKQWRSWESMIPSARRHLATVPIDGLLGRLVLPALGAAELFWGLVIF